MDITEKNTRPKNIGISTHQGLHKTLAFLRHAIYNRPLLNENGKSWELKHAMSQKILGIVKTEAIVNMRETPPTRQRY